MEIWVQNIKTKKAWILDSDVTKEVFIVNGQTTYKRGDASMWCYRFYPCDPNHCEKIEKLYGNLDRCADEFMYRLEQEKEKLRGEQNDDR
jgi:hypothetical protein